MKTCDYGCDQEAIYQLKNGNWCCSKSQNSCLEVRRKLSEVHKGKILSKETRKKLSDANKGKIFSKEHKKKLSEAGKGKKVSKEHKKKLSEIRKGKKLSKKTRKKMSEVRKKKEKLTVVKIKKQYPFFSEIEEIRYNIKEKEIQVHCKNHSCPNSKEKGGWFTPTKTQLYHRANTLIHFKILKKHTLKKNISNLGNLF